jgi:hypothetical protein
MSEAIEKYVGHHPDCIVLKSFTGQCPPCNCGLVEALAELEEKRPVCDLLDQKDKEIKDLEDLVKRLGDALNEK